MQEPSGTPHPKLFISYSHDSGAHAGRVLELAQQFRGDGIDTMIDQFVEGTPAQGWPRWMLNELESADHVLLICTPTYYRRFRGLETPGVGKGADWEGTIITNELYDTRSNSSRFVPVILDGGLASCVPEPLRSLTLYDLTQEDAYRKLKAYLAGTVAVQPAILGPSPHQGFGSAPLPSPEGSQSKEEASVSCQAVLPCVSRCAPGGTMSADDVFYIERGADQSMKAASRLLCETIVIRGPHQFGKSSLLARYAARCVAMGKRVAFVDFSRFEKQVVSHYGRFLTMLASQLARRLGLALHPGPLATQQEFIEHLETALLPAVCGPVVFAFDETDRILHQEYAPDFFSMVRMWHNDRADPALPWHNVGLALATSSEPKLFIRDALRSPFSVGLRLHVGPFSDVEVDGLNTRYGNYLSIGQRRELQRLLGGHPFLMQDAYYKLLGPEVISFAELCGLASRDDGPFGDHLRAMLSNLRAAEGLLLALKQAVALGTVPKNDDFYRLEGAGLVRRERHRIVPANQIYAEFFGRVQ